MHPSFDTLIDSFLADRIGIADQFLTTALSAHLATNLKSLYAGAQMQHAGTGNAEHATQDKAVRGDMIYWLDREHHDAHEDAFFDQMDSFVAHLNETCYTGITGYEFHYALYPEGSFYRRHLDQFRSNSSRKYSMITYLNPDWQPAQGGELSIHQHGTHQNIAPTSGKSVFFQSNEIEHEVLLTHQPRMSITGWLKVGV